MSQSLLIKGIYKNNKSNCIGCHNPKNNRNFSKKEIDHIYKMYKEHFITNLSKFKKIIAFGNIEGKEIFQINLNNINYDVINKLIYRIIKNQVI